VTAKVDREEALALLRTEQGITLQEVGRRFGVTRECIRQIVKAAGLPSKRQVYKQASKKVARLVRQIEDDGVILAKVPGATPEMVRDIRKRKETLDRRRENLDKINQAIEIVDAGASFNAAAEAIGIAAQTVQKYCEEAGVASTYGRWGALEKRREIIAEFVKRLHNSPPHLIPGQLDWEQIAVKVSLEENRETKIGSLKTWAKRNMPDVFGK
jgi:transcriptional regulator with XRE-family HTH domain